MKRVTLLAGMMLVWGCARAPSTPQMMVPPVDHGPASPVADPNRPLPRDDAARVPPPPFDDQPIVSQPMPEQTAFVDTYNRVGRPRIAVLIDQSADSTDQASAKAVADEAVKNEVSDWLACNGRVTMVAASTAEQADQTSDVIVKIHSRVARSGDDPMRVGLFAEAMNTKDKVALGRAFVDAQGPMDKTQMTRQTRLLTRKLMDEMTASWMQPDPATGAGPEAAAPPTTRPTR